MAYRATAATLAARAERETTLLQAARDIVATDGFGGASVKAIAERAGVSAGTVYTYFRTREELLAAVFRQAASTELSAVRKAVAQAQRPDDQAPAATALRALVATFAGRAIRGRALAWALLVEPVGRLIDAERLEFRGAYAELIEGIVTRGMRAGELPEQDPRIVGPGLVGLIGEALAGPLSPLDHARMSADELITGLTRLCLRAVGEGES